MPLQHFMCVYMSINLFLSLNVRNKQMVLAHNSL